MVIHVITPPFASLTRKIINRATQKKKKCQNNKKTKIPGGALTSVIANRAKVLVDVIDLVPGHAAGPDHAPGT